MSYLVLARKYRPQSFEDLVGQSHVARTLANAIAQNRVAHAFLFTGVRGVGKTTSARLLAKCLNCLGADGKATGPTATPCQVCAACREIAAGNDIDVQEIDGASYNGVDEVRRLQEGVAFRPARDRFKIYIVDEVHMLSNQAWNAFLKTLEEPPPHVKFIFATTEVHKVPVTILSRCQRYDFKLISTPMIAGRLKEVLGLESIQAEDAAVAVLAREAAGSMRDAMSLLDQVIAFGGEKLTAEDVARVLGVADRQILHELASALVGGDASAAVKVVDRLAQQGFDLGHVAKDVLRHLRNLVVAKVCGDDARALLDLADEEVTDVVELAARADADDLTRLYNGFSKAFDEIARSGQPRTALEMALVRLARRPPLLPLEELLVRLGELEKRLATGAPPPASPPARGGGGAAGSGASRGSSGAPMGGGMSSSSGASLASGSADTPRAHASAMFAAPTFEPPPAQDRTHGALALANGIADRAPELAPHAAHPRAAGPAPTFPAALPGAVPPATPPAALAAPPAPPRAVPPASTRPGPAPHVFLPPVFAPPPPPPGETPAIGLRHDAGAPGAARATTDAPAAPPAPAPRLLRPANLDAWRAIIARVRAVRAPLASILEHAAPLEVTADRVLLGYEATSFLGAQASETEALELLRREARAHFGAETTVALDLSMRGGGGGAGGGSGAAGAVTTVAALDAEARKDALAKARLAVEKHPLVEKAIAIFGAELREVRLPGGEE